MSDAIPMHKRIAMGDALTGTSLEGKSTQQTKNTTGGVKYDAKGGQGTTGSAKYDAKK